MNVALTCGGNSPLWCSGQRLGRTQEQNGVDFGDVHTPVVNIHNKNEAHFTIHQALLSGLAFLVGRIARQEHGRNIMLIEMTTHELCVIHRHAEAKTFHFADVCHIFQQGGYLLWLCFE